MNFARRILVLLVIYSASNICESSVFEQSAYHKSTTTDSQQEETCSCYVNDKGLPLVSEILETTDVGVERLVVFFYKDLYTQKIAMYIPNHTKQQIIPELAFESDDSLTYLSPTETVDNIINMNVEKNIINNFSEDPGSGLSIIFSGAIPASDYDYLANAPIDWDSDTVEVGGQVANIILPDDTSDVKAPTPVQDDITKYESLASTQPINTTNNGIIKNEPNGTNMNIVPLKNDGVRHEFIPFNNQFKPYNKESQISNKYSEIKGNQNGIDQQILNIDGNLNSIDVESLRLLVLKTLLENKINVTPDGLLIDAFGSLLDPSNLVISPILVDSSVGYDHLIMQNFLKAYMISLKNPPKVLGIVPLEKTYLSQPVSYSVLRNNNLKTRHFPTTSKTSCLKGNCYSEALLKDTPLDSPKLDVRIIPGRLEDDDTDVTQKRRMNHFLNIPPVPRAAPNSEYAVKNDKLMKNLKDNGEFSQLPSIRNTIDKIANFILFREQNDNNEIDNKENDLNKAEEGPGIRIVGGSAATGSGTPVNNKGRSGVMQII